MRSDPLGELLSGPNYEGETILTADIDIAACIRGKFAFDVVGHCARPDILQLSVNEAPTEVVRLYRRDGEMKW